MITKLEYKKYFNYDIFTDEQHGLYDALPKFSSIYLLKLANIFNMDLIYKFSSILNPIPAYSSSIISSNVESILCEYILNEMIYIANAAEIEQIEDNRILQEIENIANNIVKNK